MRIKSKQQAIARTGRFFKRISIHTSFYITNLFSKFRTIKGRRIAEAVTTEIQEFGQIGAQADINQAINGDENTIIGYCHDYLQLNFPEKPSDLDLDLIFRKARNYQLGKMPLLLQPGNAVVKQFILRARSWLFFTPISYTFQIQIKYSQLVY